jgi:hypothetical protein
MNSTTTTTATPAPAPTTDRFLLVRYREPGWERAGSTATATAVALRNYATEVEATSARVFCEEEAARIANARQNITRAGAYRDDRRTLVESIEDLRDLADKFANIGANPIDPNAPHDARYEVVRVPADLIR